MPTLLLAGALSVVAVAYSIATYARFRRLVQSALGEPDDDELERTLAARRLKLEFGLARRNVLVFARAALFGGTGCAVWQLTGGSAHYLDAAIAFGLGLAGWMGTGELYRRIGSPAELEGRLAAARRARQGVDQPSGTG